MQANKVAAKTAGKVGSTTARDTSILASGVGGAVATGFATAGPLGAVALGTAALVGGVELSTKAKAAKRKVALDHARNDTPFHAVDKESQALLLEFARAYAKAEKSVANVSDQQKRKIAITFALGGAYGGAFIDDYALAHAYAKRQGVL